MILFKNDNPNKKLEKILNKNIRKHITVKIFPKEYSNYFGYVNSLAQVLSVGGVYGYESFFLLYNSRLLASFFAQKKKE